jgi:glutaminyl-tRNA synthetase
VVRSWDDPRLYTLAALRRRGFTPAAINRFVEELGITTATTTVDVKRLENCVRDDLNKTTVRRMVVLDPLLVVIQNVPDDYCELVDLPNDPRDPSKGTTTVPLTARLYIDRSDFCLADPVDPQFFRLAPSQPVGLFKAGVVEYVAHELDRSGQVCTVLVNLDRSPEPAVKPRTFIHWVPLSPAHSSPLTAELRMYAPLFRSENPDAAPGGFLADINPHSLRIVTAYCDPRLRDASVEERFQFQRVGYFCKDQDSTDDLPVFNLTVSIKEDPNKN